MGGRRRRPGAFGETGTEAPPIPVEPVDLLAGLAPGVDLTADDVPSGLDPDGPSEARLTVAEAGRMLRAGDGTIRRLIRTAMLEPATDGGRGRRPACEPDRAGVLRRSRTRPGE